jgi:hypothetical protein
MDPADESFTPYSYVNNNPVSSVDPDGRQALNAGSYLEDNLKSLWNYSSTTDAWSTAASNAGHSLLSFSQSVSRVAAGALDRVSSGSGYMSFGLAITGAIAAQVTPAGWAADACLLGAEFTSSISMWSNGASAGLKTYDHFTGGNTGYDDMKRAGYSFFGGLVYDFATKNIVKFEPAFNSLFTSPALNNIIVSKKTGAAVKDVFSSVGLKFGL